MVIADVTIWNHTVGVVYWDILTNTGSFEFDPSFVKTGLDLSPIKMPLADLQRGNLIHSFPGLNKETYHGLPGLLADSLPDKFGNEVINAWLARQGRNADDFNPVERLCYLGKRAMGALEYAPPTNKDADTSTALDIDELVQLAREAIEVKQTATPQDELALKDRATSLKLRNPILVSRHIPLNKFKTFTWGGSIF